MSFSVIADEISDYIKKIAQFVLICVLIAEQNSPVLLVKDIHKHLHNGHLHH
jgi:hypothetical protein